MKLLWMKQEPTSIWACPKCLSIGERKAIGEARGVTKGLLRSILTLIETRFPALKWLGRQRVKALTDVDELTTLLKQLLVASDEEDARSLLTSQL